MEDEVGLLNRLAAIVLRSTIGVEPQEVVPVVLEIDDQRDFRRQSRLHGRGEGLEHGASSITARPSQHGNRDTCHPHPNNCCDDKAIKCGAVF